MRVVTYRCDICGKTFKKGPENILFQILNDLKVGFYRFDNKCSIDICPKCIDGIEKCLKRLRGEKDGILDAQR